MPGNITHVLTHMAYRMSVVVRLRDRAAMVSVAVDRRRLWGILKEKFARWASVLLVLDAQLRLVMKQHTDETLRSVRRLRQVLIRRWRRLVKSRSHTHALTVCLSVYVDIQFYAYAFKLSAAYDPRLSPSSSLLLPPGAQ